MIPFSVKTHLHSGLMFIPPTRPESKVVTLVQRSSASHTTDMQPAMVPGLIPPHPILPITGDTMPENPETHDNGLDWKNPPPQTAFRMASSS
jgi:hypothetical protein